MTTKTFLEMLDEYARGMEMRMTYCVYTNSIRYFWETVSGLCQTYNHSEEKRDLTRGIVYCKGDVQFRFVRRLEDVLGLRNWQLVGLPPLDVNETYFKLQRRARHDRFVMRGKK